jgi:hypothetical protein
MIARVIIKLNVEGNIFFTIAVVAYGTHTVRVFSGNMDHSVVACDVSDEGSRLNLPIPSPSVVV